ncbi:tautomerase family protein [Hymenobacter terrenus]|uniref:tautomerase family protein n=1 Tax=Hymenobacter terrenus TaxID=1629124 RepID=UPI000695F0FD|nr:hypothetical protein [Hymenobacter terrenus]
MPVIHISAPVGAVRPEQQADVLQGVTAAVFAWSGLPDTPQAWATLRTYLAEYAPTTSAIGGVVQQAHDAPHYEVSVTMPTGWLNTVRKQGMIDAVTRALLEAIATPFDESSRFRVRCLIPEIPDGNWGSGGYALPLSAIAAALGVEPTSLV